MPCAKWARMSAVAGATSSRSVRWATAMCSMALSTLAGAASSAANISVMTFLPVSAAKVSGVMNSCAERVITTCTSSFSCCRRRTSSAALYAAIPPVTPRTIFIGLPRKRNQRSLRRLASRSSASAISGSEYSSSPSCNSSSAMREVLRDRGLSTSGRPPIISCRARRETTTTCANWLSGIAVSVAMATSASKKFQNFKNSTFGPGHAASRAESDGLYLTAGAFEIVVDDGEIVAAVTQHFVPCAIEAAANFVLRILAALSDAALKIIARRRNHENRDGPWEPLSYLQSALDVNLEDQVFLVRQRFVQRCPRRTVPIFAKDLRVFQKLAAGHHALELRLGNEIVPFAGAFRPTRGARGGRNSQHGVGELQNLLNERGLSRARWPGNDQDQWLRLAHSIFCTCSRIFSISPLIPSASSVISRLSFSLPGVFERSVLASRCISCRRKSSFLPTSDAPASSDSNWRTWLASRASSSETSLRSAAMAASWARRAGSIWNSPRSSFRRVSRRRANAGRARSASRETRAAGVAMVTRRADMSSRRAAASCSRMRSSLSSASCRQLATAGSRRAISSSGEAAAEAVTPGRRKIAARSGSDLTPYCLRNSSTARRYDAATS